MQIKFKLNHPLLFYAICSIIADLGSKINIEKSVIKDGLSNTEYDEHTRISWKYGCSSKCVIKTNNLLLSEFCIQDGSLHSKGT